MSARTKAHSGKSVTKSDLALKSRTTTKTSKASIRKSLRRTADVELSVHNESSLTRVPRALIRQAIERCVMQHKVYEATVSVVLMSDAAIRKINKQFLQHDYATDVITFPLEDGVVDGEIYISVDTTQRQANEYGVSFRNELLRLVIHGVLHLLGFDDATPELREAMHQEENVILDQIEWQA